MPEEEGSRGQRFGVRGLWVFVLRRSPWGARRSQKALSISWGRATALSAMPSAGKTTRQTPMSGCVPGRGQCHPPGTSLPSAAASEPHPNLSPCERPGMLPARRLAFLFFFFSRYFLYFSWFFFSTLFKAGVCLFVFQKQGFQSQHREKPYRK